MGNFSRNFSICVSLPKDWFMLHKTFFQDLAIKSLCLRLFKHFSKVVHKNNPRNKMQQNKKGMLMTAAYIKASTPAR